MREILFRGKMKTDSGEYKRGAWVYGDFVTLIDGKEAHPHIYGKGEIATSTIGQYTGLTDKNGAKVFEGDIVKLFYKDGFEIGLIGWSNIDFRYKFASPDGTAYGFDVTDVFEVVGNIHDNPELLGGAE